MYLHIGGDTVLPDAGIAGIFDLDGASRGRGTLDFLKRCEREGRLIQTHTAIPRSFIVTADGTAYLSPITTATLYKRLLETEKTAWMVT